MRGVFMKKIILAVMVISLAALFVTCDEPITDDDAIVEYSDVVYSPDGSEVTIYLDGKTVPVTKAQRAMTRDLAMMAYDFLEVIFISTATTARTNWELGQPAGIYGVDRNGADATPANRTNYSLLANACLFAGKKSDKTLFGIGQLTVPSDGLITDNTDYVKFEIAAILAGLLKKGETTASVTAPPTGRGVAFNSFGVSEDEVNLGGVDYPLYTLKDGTLAADLVEARAYTFGMVQDKTANLAAAKLYLTATSPDLAPAVIRRTPRFMDGGAYREPKTLVNSKTKVTLGTLGGAAGTTVIPMTAIVATNNAFNNYFTGGAVPLVFQSLSGATGYFSFYLEIPVYMVSNTSWTLPTIPNPSDPNTIALSKWTNPVTWFIRSGYGSELYSIDDGTSSGGCVLMGRGTSSSGDWLEIIWTWLPYSGS